MNNCHIDPDLFVTLWQWGRAGAGEGEEGRIRGRALYTHILEDLLSCISRKTGLEILSFWMAYYLPDWMIHFSDQPEIFLAHCKFI